MANGFEDPELQMALMTASNSERWIIRKLIRIENLLMGKVNIEQQPLHVGRPTSPMQELMKNSVSTNSLPPLTAADTNVAKPRKRVARKKSSNSTAPLKNAHESSKAVQESPEIVQEPLETRKELPEVAQEQFILEQEHSQVQNASASTNNNNVNKKEKSSKNSGKRIRRKSKKAHKPEDDAANADNSSKEPSKKRKHKKTKASDGDYEDDVSSRSSRSQPPKPTFRLIPHSELFGKSATSSTPAKRSKKETPCDDDFVFGTEDYDMLKDLY